MLSGVMTIGQPSNPFCLQNWKPSVPQFSMTQTPPSSPSSRRKRIFFCVIVVCAFLRRLAGGRHVLQHGFPDFGVTKEVGQPRREGPICHLLCWFPVRFVAGCAACVACVLLYSHYIVISVPVKSTVDITGTTEAPQSLIDRGM